MYMGREGQRTTHAVHASESVPEFRAGRGALLPQKGARMTLNVGRCHAHIPYRCSWECVAPHGIFEFCWGMSGGRLSWKGALGELKAQGRRSGLDRSRGIGLGRVECG